MFRPSRTRSLPKARRAALRVEQMEERALLSTLYGPISVPPHAPPPLPIIVHPPQPPTPPPPPVTPPA
jgi:hypothetical protein